VTIVDLQGGPGVVQMDVEKDFPFESNQFDCVISVHLFEHVRFFQNSASEINRVLKKDGIFILCLPFFYPYHPDPKDYFRFTLDAIIATWVDDSDLDCIQVEFLGPGAITNQIMPLFDYFQSRLATIFIRAPIYVCLASLDFVIFHLTRKKGQHRVSKRFALEHLVVMKKDG
jgi:SAM-dependent methyltransferase